jgi:hypothetical protein
MKRAVSVVAGILLTGAAAAYGAGSTPEPKEVRGTGCVEAGIEMRCLVVKDVKSGKLYNLLVKEPRPRIGDGIKFTGELYNGITYCMQGIAVEVTDWAHDDALTCGQSQPPKQ